MLDQNDQKKRKSDRSYSTLMQRVWRLLVQNQTHRGDVAHFAEELFQLIFLGLGTKSQNQDYLDTSIHYVVNP